MTPQFTDRTGRAWDVAVTFGHLGPLKRDAGLDLLEAGADLEALVGAVLGVPFPRIVAALWLLCEGQARARGVTPEEWGYLFDGPAMFDAGRALGDAVLDFFLPPEVARTVRAAVRGGTTGRPSETSSGPAGS